MGVSLNAHELWNNLQYEKEEYIFFVTVVYVCIVPVSGSQMLCSRPHRCSFLYGKQTCFSSVALTWKQEILDHRWRIWFRLKHRQLFVNAFFHQYQKYWRAWSSVFGIFFLYHVIAVFYCFGGFFLLVNLTLSVFPLLSFTTLLAEFCV